MTGRGAAPFLATLLIAAMLTVSPATAVAATGWNAEASLITATSDSPAATAPCPGGSPISCIYVFGGPEVQVYDPGTNTWTSSGTSGSCGSATPACMPFAQDEAAATAAPCPSGTSGTCVYVMGGRLLSVSIFFDLQTLNVYDPTTNTWTSSDVTPGDCSSGTVPCMPSERYRLTAATAPCPGGAGGFCVYAIGGEDTLKKGTDFLNTSEVYDPATNTWTENTAMPTARSGLTSVADRCPGSAAQTCIYVAGGADSPTHEFQTLEIYNITTDTWTSSDTGGSCASLTVACMPTARTDPGGALAPCPDGSGHACFYVIGGFGGGADLQTVEAYDPVTNTWTSSDTGGSCSSITLPCLPTPARFLVPTASAPCADGSIGPCIYVMGGYSREAGSGGSDISDVDMFDTGTPTAAWVTRFSAQRTLTGVRFRWRTAEMRGAAGFLIYAGQHRLTPRVIPPHRNRQYEVLLRWRGKGEFTLHVLQTRGAQAVVVAH
jgi:hypothetical protein